jgi:hypothetical protein
MVLVGAKRRLRKGNRVHRVPLRHESERSEGSTSRDFVFNVFVEFYMAFELNVELAEFNGWGAIQIM